MSLYGSFAVVVIVFDLTSIRSLISCDQWLKDAISVNPHSPLIFLIGNKMDLLVSKKLNTKILLGSY